MSAAIPLFVILSLIALSLALTHSIGEAIVEYSKLRRRALHSEAGSAISIVWMDPKRDRTSAIRIARSHRPRRHFAESKIAGHRLHNFASGANAV